MKNCQLRRELFDLDKRILMLWAYVHDNPDFRKETPKQQGMIRHQLRVMTDYAKILRARIEDPSV